MLITLISGYLHLSFKKNIMFSLYAFFSYTVKIKYNAPVENVRKFYKLCG